MSIDEIVCQVTQAGIGLVEVTGGEPLAQEGTRELLRRLNERGFRVLLETSGALSISSIDPRTVVIMDVKTPGSGMSDGLCLENMNLLSGSGHQVKFVVTDRDDFDFSVGVIDQYHLRDRVETLISPVAGLNTELVAQWILESRLPLRLQLQLHRLIWPSADSEGQER